MNVASSTIICAAGAPELGRPLRHSSAPSRVHMHKLCHVDALSVRLNERFQNVPALPPHRSPAGSVRPPHLG